jgi:hypothetical protein
MSRKSRNKIIPGLENLEILQFFYSLGDRLDLILTDIQEL